MLRADQTSQHSATGTQTQIANYYRPGYRLDDALSWGSGPLFASRPGVRMPVPISSTQYSNAGFNPTMGRPAPKTMGGVFDTVGNLVSGAIDWISGGPQKRARDKVRTREHEQELAEMALRQAMLESETARYTAELAAQTEARKAEALQKTLLIVGGLGIGALTLVLVMKKRKS